MSTHINHNDLNDLFKPRPEEKEVKHDSLLLMAAFLSEIEYFQEQKNISRKELAEKIKTTPSYLTQVFRSKKPLNFLTLAKIKRALNLRFEVKAFEKETIPVTLNTLPVYHQINPLKMAQQFLKEKNDTQPQLGSKFITKGNFSSASSQIIKKNDSVISFS